MAPGETVSALPAQPGTARAASGKQHGPTLYVLNAAFKDRVPTVTVYGDAGSTLLRTISSPPNTFGFNDLTADTSGHLFLGYFTGGTHHNEPGFLRIYSDRGSRVVQRLKQSKPFLLSMLDGLGNLFTVCATKRVCEYAAADGSKVVKQDVIRRIALGRLPHGGFPYGFASDSLGNVAINENGWANVFAPAQTSPYWTITAGPDCGISSMAFDSKGDLYVACAGDDYSGGILEYAPGEGQYPIRYLYGPDGVGTVTGIKVDSADNVYALNNLGVGLNVIVFPPTGSVPLRVISQGIAREGVHLMTVDSLGDVYVSNSGEFGSDPGNVVVYPPGGTTPVRTVTDGVMNPQELAVGP